jgi:hypothetical protein
MAVIMQFSATLEGQITTPHRHEDAACPPLWLIWVNKKDGDGWALHCVGNSEEATRYCIECYGGGESAVIVERIPANHAFASSIESELREANHRIAVRSYNSIHGYRRQGD